MRLSFRNIFFVLVTLSLLSSKIALADPQDVYQPTHDSVSKHPLPDWYVDAKFGVIIHYGIYTVPGWAPLFDPTGKLFSKEFFYNNPYPEWYLNSMQIEGSPTYEYHKKYYGVNFKYDDFIPLFEKALQKWNPDNWSELLAAGGVKYVVFVTKHHDGYLLWPSAYPNPYKQNYRAPRDVVGELTDSVRNHGMRMGLYYSGGYDWTWPSDNDQPITDFNSATAKVPQSIAYSDYVFNQWNELITKYHPDLIWNDIALPSNVDKWQLFANYYNQVSEGVFNNRWEQGNTFDFTVFGQPDDGFIDMQLKADWFDYYSPEYLPHYQLVSHKWEADHGVGYAFGYNREEYLHPEHLKTLDQLIGDLADVVSKNGNLLLGIGPEADGTIPEYQRDLLLGIGIWLKKNGEAIYATKPWGTAEGIANGGEIPVRFTQSKDGKYLYIILLKNPLRQTVTLNQCNVPFSKVEVLNGNAPITVSAQHIDGNLQVNLSKLFIPVEHPLVLRMTIEYT